MAEAEIISALEPLEKLAGQRQRGLWSDAFFRLTRNRLAIAALVVLGLLAALALLGNNVDAVRRYGPSAPDYDALLTGPSGAHFFGTDNLGRDTWSRILQGTLISLQVGFGVQAIAVVIGMLVGGTAALGGRALDNIMMRFTDLAYAFPDLLFIILMRAVLQGRDWPILGQPVPQMIFAIAVVSWVTIARLVRGQMLSLQERDFVLAARAMGASPFRIVIQHMLPNTLGPVIVAITFGIPLAIFAEAVLGFIGFGVPPPTASLGRLVSDGYSFIRVNVWMVLFPAGTIALLMLCFTFIGDGLRDALDPRSR
ncbi:MAG: ABC transporter permease [Dehalococcoidia bacterium]|nr:ABC transporter permease [Dehalococcoidia bacterium]